MKRILSFLLIAIMLFSMFLLTSCDPIGYVESFVNKVFGVDRYTVTEDEWNNAFNISNYTAILLSDEHKVITSLDYPYMKYEMFNLKDTEQSALVYIVDLKTGDIYYNEDGEWIVVNEKSYIVDESRASLREDLRIDEINFNDLEYDDETKSYTYNKLMEADLVFKFENGVLVSIEMFMKAGLDNTKQIATNFGTTVVELPQVDD